MLGGLCCFVGAHKGEGKSCALSVFLILPYHTCEYSTLHCRPFSPHLKLLADVSLMVSLLTGLLESVGMFGG